MGKWIIYGLAFACGTGFAAVPVLEYPDPGATAYQTLPYFEWSDVVPHPYVGQYEIQIDDNSDFSSPFDTDIIPALLSWYSPTEEMVRGTTYYWRVRYMDEQGTPDEWSTVSAFAIGFPYVIDVLTTDGWDEIQAKHVQVADYGHTNAQAAELRFPANHTFNLVQDPADDYLFEYNSHDNYIINGRGSTIIMQCTQKTNDVPKCGFWLVQNCNHLQIRDIIIDYAPDSLSQFGGVISNLDKDNRSFTVTVDTNVYANFDEAAPVAHGYFVDAENLQRLGVLGTGLNTVTNWDGARQSDTVFDFTIDPDWAGMWNQLTGDLENGDYFISSPVPDRGGDIFYLFNSVADFVANNVTTRASRGRYFVVRKSNSLYNRCINNDFLRTQGRLRGAASGGVNNHGDYAWYENCAFDYTRDDAFHNGSGDSLPDGPGQAVVRHCRIESCFRNSLWVQMDRHWVADNTVTWPGSAAIHIGETGQGDGASNSQMDVGLIENNLVVRPYKQAFRSGYNPNIEPDPVTGEFNQYVTIRNNTIIDNKRNQAFDLEYLKNSTVENNVVSNRFRGWSAYHDPALQIGFHLRNSTNVVGIGNRVADNRITPENQLVVDASSTSNITVEVIDDRWVDIYTPLFSETWENAAAGFLTGTGTLNADNDWNCDAVDWTNWGVIAVGAPLSSRAFGIESYGASSLNPIATSDLPKPLSPNGGDKITIKAKVVFSGLTLSGRSNSQLSLMNAAGNEFYQVEFNTQADNAEAVRISVSGQTILLGAIGEQEEGVVYDLIVEFRRLSASETEVTYDITKADGTFWKSSVQTLPSAISGGTTLEKAQLSCRQRGTVLWDDIEVGIDLEGYGLWALSFNLSEGPDGNDDSDALDNLSEYALGGNPINAADIGYPIHFAIEGTDAVYVHPQLSDPDAGILYIVETTDNLVSNVWNAVELMETNPAGYAVGFDAVTNRISTFGKTNEFIRLKIAEK